MENLTSIPSNITISTVDITNWYVYIFFGTAAVVANIVVIFVLLRNKDLFRQSPFVSGLAFGDIFNGIGLFVTGVIRLHYSIEGVSILTHPFNCLKTFTSMWLIGNQAPMIMIFLVGIERVIAVTCYSWYHKKWSSRLGWYLTVSVYIYVTFSVATGWIVIYNVKENTRVSVFCYTPGVLGPTYGSYNYGLAILCGSSAIVTTFVSLGVMLMKKKGLRGNMANANVRRFMKKQWQLTTSMTCIAVCDFIMVVIQNVILLALLFPVNLPAAIRNIGFWAADLVCLRSALTFFIYLFLNRDFRVAFFRSFGCLRARSLVQPTLTNAAAKINHTAF